MLDVHLEQDREQSVTQGIRQAHHPPASPCCPRAHPGAAPPGYSSPLLSRLVLLSVGTPLAP